MFPNNMEYQYDVFISYSRHDYADELSSAPFLKLAAAGLQTLHLSHEH